MYIDRSTANVINLKIKEKRKRKKNQKRRTAEDLKEVIHFYRVWRRAASDLVPIISARLLHLTVLRQFTFSRLESTSAIISFNPLRHWGITAPAYFSLTRQNVNN